MTEAVIVALIAALVPSLTILSTWWQQNKRLDVQDRKLDEVHGVVNSRLDAALASIKALEAEVRMLKQDIQ